MDRSREDHEPPHLPRSALDALGGADFGRSLERWAADAVVDEAARTRIRERWLRIQSEESASLAGTLMDLAERCTPLVIDVADQQVRGVVVGLGGDFVALRTHPGAERTGPVLVRSTAIAAIRAEPGSVEVRGDRSTTLDVTLGAVLGPVAADRPDVLVRTLHGQVLRGELRSAGVDVIRLRVPGVPPTPVWVPLDAVAMLVIDA